MARFSPLSFCAPRRDSVTLPDGRWASCAWSASAVLAYRRAGGWFKSPAYHDFADKAAITAAYS